MFCVLPFCGNCTSNCCLTFPKSWVAKLFSLEDSNVSRIYATFVLFYNLNGFSQIFFFLKTVTAELSETDHRPPSGTQRMLSQIFPYHKYFFFPDISQKALNKSHHVGRFCAALLPKAARCSKELSCYGVENYRATFHPPSSVFAFIPTTVQNQSATFCRCASPFDAAWVWHFYNFVLLRARRRGLVMFSQ